MSLEARFQRSESGRFNSAEAARRAVASVNSVPPDSEVMIESTPPELPRSASPRGRLTPGPQSEA